jgi:hypothetical protein
MTMSEAAVNRGNKRKAKNRNLPGNKSQKEKLEMDALRRGAISAFILFHLVAIACVAIPAKALAGAKDLFMPYMRWSGLFQSWDMFAPEPQSVDSYMKAVVITRDHHIKVWAFPRMEELSLFEKFRKERYRKFAEVLPQPQFAPLWPDVASHVARFFNNPADPPEKIMLIQFQSEIRPDSREPESTARPNVFYDDYLQPGDLK